MPYPGVPSAEWAKLDACVLKVMATGKDKSSAIAICRSSMGLSEEFGELKGVELFMPGNHAGKDYTEKDVDDIIENTNALISSKRHDPPAKLGHDDSQAFAKESGLPAVGWVTRVYRKGKKMVADFGDVPQLVMDAIAKRRYRKVSVELYLEKASEHYFGVKGKVLRAVAFLGADVPEVKGLQPFMASDVQEGDTATVTVALQEEGVADKNGKEPDGDEGGGGPLMVPANRHPLGALVSMKGQEGKHRVYNSHPDGTYDVAPLHDAAGAMHKAVPHKDLTLLTEQQEENVADEKAVKAAEAARDEAVRMAEESRSKVRALEEAALDKDIAAFAEKNKTVLTPALAPKFLALCKARGETVALSEKEKPVAFHEALMSFFSELMDAKLVRLGEMAPQENEGATAELATEVKLAEETYKVHQDEARGKKPELANADLAVRAERYAEEHKVSYGVALKHCARLEAVAREA